MVVYQFVCTNRQGELCTLCTGTRVGQISSSSTHKCCQGHREGLKQTKLWCIFSLIVSVEHVSRVCKCFSHAWRNISCFDVLFVFMLKLYVH